MATDHILPYNHGHVCHPNYHTIIAIDAKMENGLVCLQTPFRPDFCLEYMGFIVQDRIITMRDPLTNNYFFK
jgi:hypothetical protein